MTTEPREADVLDTPEAGPATIRGGALRALAHGIGVVLAFASAPLLVRHLGVGDFGVYVLIGSIVGVAGGVLDAGLLTIAQREYVARSGADRDRTMAHIVGLRLVLMSSAAAAATLFALAAGYDSTVVLGTIVAGVALFIASGQHVFSTPLSARLRFGATTAIEVTGQVLTVALIVTLVLLDAGVLAFVAVSIPVSFLALVITTRLVRGDIPLRPAFDRRAWWELVKDTLPFAAAAAITAVYYRLALIVLSLVETKLETGYFATAVRISDIVGVLPGLVLSAAFPVMTRAATDEDDARFGYQVGRVIEVAFLIGLGLLLAFELGAPIAVDVIAGDEGEPATAVLRTLAPGIVFSWIAVACAFALLGMKRYTSVLVANATALVVSLTLVLVLAPSLGGSGAALAAAVAEGVLAVAMVVQLRRAKPSVRLPWRAVLPALALAGVGASALLLPAPAVVQTVVGLGIYAGGLLLFRRVPEEVFEAFPFTRAWAARRTS